MALPHKGNTMPTATTLSREMKANNVFGMPVKQMKKAPMKGKKMAPHMIAKRKKAMISNAATKVMGGNYSK